MGSIGILCKMGCQVMLLHVWDPLLPISWKSLQSVDSVRQGLWTPFPPFLYQNPESKCWKLFYLCLHFPVKQSKMFQAQFLLWWVVLTVLPLLQHLVLFFNYDASFSKISFSFFNYYIWVRAWINAQYDCLLLWSNINSSLWYHSMFLFNFNDFLFWTSPSMGWLNISATSDGTPG